MALRNPSETPNPGIVADRDEPVFAIPILVNGQERELFITASEYEESFPESVGRALELAGAWSDLDWEEMAESLDRIRHESIPTPPIDLDEL
jgi:hypothetical protein